MNNEIINDLFLDCDDVATVKIVNEEEVIVINHKSSHLHKLDESLTYYEYFSSFRNIIHSIDLADYDYLIDGERIINKICAKSKVNAAFKVKDLDEVYRTYQFEVIISNSENYDAILLWKKASNYVDVLEESLRMLLQTYDKIFKINIDENTYQLLKSNTPNQPCRILSKAINDFVSNGNVYPDDASSYLEFFNIDRLSKSFTDIDSSKQIFRYRRKQFIDGYRWFAVTLITSRNFIDGDRVVLAYERDVHEDYIYQLMEQRKLHYFSTHDSVTGLQNKLAYLDKASNLPDYISSLGVCYIKLKNESFSPAILVEYARKCANSIVSVFDEMECFRINDNEFIVLVDGLDEETFNTRVDRLKSIVDNYEVGYAWSDKEKRINVVLNEAEDMLYKK